MKKTFKRLGAMFLAMVMAVSVLCTGAFADSEYIITINGKTTGHTYEAYQVFTGTLHTKTAANEETNQKAEYVLSDIVWGSAVKSSDEGAAFLTALKNDSTIGNVFNTCTTAAEVADVLSTNETAKLAENFAAFVGKYVVNNKISATATSGNQTSGTTYKIGVQNPGYYLVKDQDKSVNSDKYDAYTNYILQVVGDVTVEPKTSVPTVDKKIIVNNEEKTETTVGVNNTVTFKLTGTLPKNYADYTTYKYVFHDTLSSGLTLDENSIEVKVYKNGKIETEGDNCVTLDKGTSDGNYSVLTGDSVSENDNANKTNCTFEVKIDDLKKINGLNENSIIVVTYTATLNSGAVIAGNDNTVHLEYSNNPNGEGTGNTNDKKVTVYTLQLDVVKVDGSDDTHNTPLAGAKFILSTNANLQDQLTDTNVNTDGSLTENNTLANSLIAVKANTSPNYVVDDSTANKNYVMAVADNGDDKGKLNIQGLEPNKTYYLYETKAPDGYNKLTKPVEIKIDAEGKATVGNTALTTDSHEIKTLYVENNAGSNLPSTGGMGTKLFYTIGGLLMAGAAIVLVIKKRRSSAE